MWAQGPTISRGAGAAPVLLCSSCIAYWERVLGQKMSNQPPICSVGNDTGAMEASSHRRVKPFPGDAPAEGRT